MKERREEEVKHGNKEKETINEKKERSETKRKEREREIAILIEKRGKPPLS